MPAQDGARGDQAMAAQALGQPPDEGGEDRPVRPVQAWSWVGAAENGDLVPQHEELDVLGGGRAAQQQDQPEHLPEDQIQQAQRHVGDHARLSHVVNHRWSATVPDFWNPTGGHGGEQVERLTQVAVDRRRADVEADRKVGVGLALAQLRHDQQRLAAGVQSPPPGA